MKIALASCSSLPGWEADDKPLIDGLRSRGACVETPAWSEPCDWNQYDVTVIRTTWDYHLQIDAFLQWVDTVPRLFNSPKIIKWNSHKSYLRELESKGSLIAPTIWIPVGDSVNIKNAMTELQTHKGFIKPQVGAGASDTFRFDESRFEVAQQFLQQRKHIDMMIQPYFESVETIGEFSGIFIEGKFTHGVQKIPVNGDYRVQDEFGASDQPYTFSAIEIASMERTLKQVPDYESLLYARCDYLMNQEHTLVLNEIELVEPSLFFRHDQKAADQFAAAIVKTATK